MNSLMHLFSLGLIVFVTAQGAPAAENQPIVGFRVGEENLSHGSLRVCVGTTRETVRLLYGTPDVTIGVTHCVYWDWRVRPASANPQGFDTLVLSFTDDVVSEMKLVDGHTLRRFLGQRAVQASRSTLRDRAVPARVVGE